MNNLMVYGISGLLICFTVLCFFLHRFKADVIPEDYEFKLDPFWYVIAVLFIGASGCYLLFPNLGDNIKVYSYLDILVPFALAVVIYLTYLLDVAWIVHLLTMGAALGVSFMLPHDFMLFDGKLTYVEERLVVALVLFVITKGLGLLNGLGGVAAMQFCAVMLSIFFLVYLGSLPQIMGALALTYLGGMLAFLSFSWPNEKVIMSNGGFSAIGFVMGCFMLNGAQEFAESSMLIAASFLITEVGIALYDRIICLDKKAHLYMNTSYYRAAGDGQYATGVVLGVLKILIIDIVLAIVQIAAHERLALPVFAVALNLWFLSILSGDTNPDELISFSRWGKNMIKGLWSKKNKKDQS